MSNNDYQKVGVDFRLKTLEKRIKDFLEDYRQNLAILGRDREEIKCILENYFYWEKNDNFIHICIDASFIESKDFLKNVTYSILASFLSLQSSLDNLINEAQTFLPSTINLIKENLKKSKVNFIDILEVINKFINESNRRCILIIEEFDDLKEVFKDYCQDFAKFIILQKKCMLILTSSKIKKAKRILGAELNLLFGNFEVVYLDQIPLLDNYLYFMNLLHPVNPNLSLVAFFINIISTATYYQRLIAEAINNIYNGNEEETIINVIEQTLYNRNSVLFQKFINKLNILKEKYKDYRTLIKILFLMSEGYIRKNDIAFFSRLEKNELNLKLQHLSEEGYLENLGNIFKISDSLFSFWLSNIFNLYFFPYLIDKKERYKIFRKRLKEEIEIFREDFYKGKAQRILELFSSFKNDTIVIGNSRRNLPLLNNIKIIPYPEKRFNLLIGEGTKIVFAGIKEDETEDTDILEFISQTGPLKTKNLRRIFISLGKLNPSVRLIAKEGRICLWDLNEVNNLLRIYNKPVLI
jgi:hypothetical protein